MIKRTDSTDYIVDDRGNFRFTKEGLESQASLLRKAGIDARSIKTFDQYLQARKASSPYFDEYLREMVDEDLAKDPDCLERQLIRAVIYGDKAQQKIIIDKIDRKKALKLV